MVCGPIKKLVEKMITIEGKFQIEEWFDIAKRIDKDDADLAEAQICLYALKDGIDP